MQFISTDQTSLPYLKELRFAGVVCDLQTNSAELADVLERLSLPSHSSVPGRFTMCVAINQFSKEGAGTPHFRGMHHVVVASFGSSNVFVFDILRRTLTANISEVVALDLRFWKEKLIPISLGILGAAMGLVPVHCACLAMDGDGLLIAGVSGAGKSTLSVALAESGFDYVSDDWTYISRSLGRILAHGTSAPVKLLPDAKRHFASLNDHETHISMNGELAYEVSIADAFDANVKQECEPLWLLFLERTERPGSIFTPMSPFEAQSYVESSIETLPAQLSEAIARRRETIEKISQLPCWRFSYGGTPQFAAEQLHEFVANRRVKVYA
jgi:hypothetical protein